MKTALAAALGLALLGIAPGHAAAADAIVVASKIDTEGALLGDMIATALAAHGLPVKNEMQLGPTQILRQAILAGQIDLYPEYTGDGAVFFKREGDPAWRDAAAGYALVKSLDWTAHRLVWLAAAPANNSWGIALRRDLATERKLASLADLARYLAAGGRFKLAASAEFVESPGALPAFETAYGFRLKQAQLLILAGGDTAATIHAAAEGTSGGVNAAMAYGTDGALVALGLTLLADDKRAQIVYRPAPVLRDAVLAKHPEIPAILDPIFSSLTRTVLQTLNAKIAVDGFDAGTVARDYLVAHGFLR